MKNAVAHFKLKPSGCYWYRVQRPMLTLEASGVKLHTIELDKDVEGFDDINSFQFYGAFPFSMGKVLKSLKESGKKIIYDSDDALDLIDLSNPFYYNVKKDAGSVDEVLRHTDHVTVSTPAMKRYMSTKTSLPITVIPNTYTPEEWTFPRPIREGIRIGFSGSATHVKDLIDIIPVIETLQKKYDITFLILGFGQTDYQTWYKEFSFLATEEAKEDLIELDKRLSRIKFEWVSFVPQEQFPSTLINMALDIGLCPLIDTPFNRCRSACKAMEYTLAGAVALASDLEPYQNDKNSVLIKNGEWEETIERFIKDKELRESTLKSHMEWTKENRINETNLEALKSIYL